VTSRVRKSLAVIVAVEPEEVEADEESAGDIPDAIVRLVPPLSNAFEEVLS
jgi:hypothetical protein